MPTIMPAPAPLAIEPTKARKGLARAASIASCRPVSLHWCGLWCGIPLAQQPTGEDLITVSAAP
eukprot:CAMPEP_0179485520 /NCGR_PEP_ID=MMETSP0799-20121207/62092_1 /TAXON_ID=46947 /ORGANISM="Geminigera cryophila, Strain CCMP2564" /LENGTH=63 /DNA_ID=CAMNT_0021299897 /DNA_START=494 /DNA_END=681 /DNA_ORIENTATION=-